MEGNHLIAVVTHVVRKGQHGPYAVGHAENSNSEIFGEAITFSLQQPCWKETSLPEKGTLVVLHDIQRKRSGWRALKARYVRPQDQLFLDKEGVNAKKKQ